MLILSMVMALTEITLIMLFTLTFLHVRIPFLLQWLNVKVCFGSRSLKFSSKRKTNLRDWSLFITWGDGGGGGAENVRGDHLIFRRTKGGINRN